MQHTEGQLFSSIEAENTARDYEFQKLLQTLEQRKSSDGHRLIKYEGFWYREQSLRPVLSSRMYFKAKNTDLILASMPKSGTTWLKALTFSIANRRVYSIDQSPLLTSNPHALVPFLEFDVYSEQENPDLEQIPSPRMFSTHVPFKDLAPSILESECKIIYICRNPLDHFISHRHFLLQNFPIEDAMMDIDGAFDLFCRGIHPFGPFWDHMISYWHAHMKNPQKVLFLKYEDLKDDVGFYIKKIGEFMGFPFSFEEENRGLIEQISSLCSFEKLSNLEINRAGNRRGVLKNNSYFRKGKVGDWTNYLTRPMAERIKTIMESKFEGTGLTFKI